MIDQDLISLFIDTFKLDINGIHGLKHWSRVRINGLKIAKLNGANPRVIELFSFFHDVKRMNDDRDIYHGKRSSEFVKTLSNDLLKINDDEKYLLAFACEHHSHSGEIKTDDTTILTCFDADALDLGRVSIMPDTKRLYTDIAKDNNFLKDAYNRSIYAKKVTIKDILRKPWIKYRL